MNRFKLLRVAVMFTLALLGTAFATNAQTSIAIWKFAGTTQLGNIWVGLSDDVTCVTDGITTSDCGLYHDGTLGSTEITSSHWVSGSSGNKVASCDAETVDDDVTNSLKIYTAAGESVSIVFKISTLPCDMTGMSYDTKMGANGYTTHAWEYSLDGTNYTAITTFTELASTDYETKTIDLSEISAINIQDAVYFRLTMSGAASTGTQASECSFLDNVTFLGNVFACKVPTSIAASNVTSTTATVSWSAAGSNEANFSVAWTTDANSDPNTLTAATTTSHNRNLTNLTPGTKYYVYVKANCGDEGNSLWTSTSFTTCEIPTITMSNNGATTATFNWTRGTSTAWDVLLSSTAILDWTSATRVTDTTYTVTGLTAATNYVFAVRTACDECENCQVGTETSYPFTTNFADEVTTITIGEGTSTNYYAPYNAYYNNSWSQSIYTLEEIGHAGLIGTVAWYGGSSASIPASDVRIYMGITSMSTVGTSDWVPASDLTLVYSATNTTIGGTAGWKTYTLDTPFNYDGSGNLVVVFAKASTTYSSSLTTRYSNVSGRTIYRNADGTASYAQHPGTASGSSTYLPNIQLGMGNLTSVCMPVATLSLSGLSDSGVTVYWNPGGEETNWTVKYGAAGFDVATEGTSINVTESTYTIEGLSANTAYDIYVKAVCDAENNDESGWSKVSFRTPCDAVELPYSEDFETYTASATSYSIAGVMPTCWEYSFAGAASYAPHVSNTIAIEGVGLIMNAGYSYYGGVSDSYVILPNLAGDMSNVMIKFDYKMNSTSYGSLKFGYMTNPADPTTFTQIRQLTAATTATNAVIDMSNESELPAGARFAFRWNCTYDYSYYYCNIDNITVSALASCGYVTAVTIDDSDITPTSAEITWTNSATPTAWQIVVSPTAIADFTGVTPVDVTEASYSATGLNANTLYYVYVRTDCGEGEYSAWTSASFRTACAALTTYPFEEGFENLSALPHCWTKVGDGTIAPNNSTSYAHGGTYSLKFSGVTGGNIVALPEFGDDISGLVLSFYTRPESYEYSSCGTFEVGYITDLTNTSSFVAVETYSYNDFSAVTYKEVYMTEAPSGSYFAFNHKANSTAYYWFLDDVKVDLAPECMPISGLTLSNITGTTATASWTENGSSTSWQYVVSATAITDMTTVAAEDITTVATTTVDITGLASSTRYHIYVRPICDADEYGDWVSAIFATECDVISTFPYTEGFNDGVRPNCWSEITTGTHNWVFNQTGTNSSYYPGTHSGSYNASYRHVSEGDVNKLVSPVFDFGTETSAILTFWRRNPSWSGDIDYLKVYYRTSSAGSWTLLQSYTNASSTWKQETITLTNLTSTYQLAFEATDNYGYGVGLDDVKIYFLSSDAEIESFNFAQQTREAIIDSENATVSCEVSYSADLTTLVPAITVSDGATINPATGVARDFTTDVTYVVTAENNTTKTWTVSVANVTTAATGKDILSFTFPGIVGEAVIDATAHTVTANAAWTAVVSALNPTITISPLATITPTGAQNFTAPFTYTVTAEDETSQDWVVTITQEDAPAGLACYTAFEYGEIDGHLVEGTLVEGVNEYVWYTFTLDENYSFVEISTCGTEFDNRFNLYTSCDGLQVHPVYILGLDESIPTLIGGDDDSCNDDYYAATATFNNLPAGTYYIIMNVYGSSEYGNYDLTINGSTCGAPANLAAPLLTIFNTSAVITWDQLNSDDEYQLVYGATALFNTSNDTVFDLINTCTLTGLTAETEYTVKVRMVCGAGEYSDWSTIVFTTQPDCSIPIELEASDITTTSVDLAWVGGTATSWKIQYKTTAMGWDYANEIVVDAATYTLTGLTPATKYDIRVSGICADEESDFGTAIQVLTLCDIVSTFPWSEDFSSATTTDLPVCWSQNNANGDDNKWQTNGGQAYLYTDYIESDDYLILPQFAFNGNYVFSYKVKEYYTNEPDDYTVLISTTGTNPEDFTVLRPSETINSTSYVTREINLPGYTGNYYIAMYCNSNDGGNLYFDDFSITEMPSCVAPSDIVTTTTGTSVSITWTDVLPATAWQVAFMDDTLDIDAKPFVIDTLQPTTSYSIFVRTVCGENEYSEWVPATFVTPCVGETVPYTEGFENLTALPQCWTKVGNGTIAPYSSTSYAHGGTYSLKFSGTTGGNIVALPAFDANISSLVFSFYTRPESFTNSSCGTFEVGYITNLQDPNTFVAVETYSYSSFSGIEQKEMIMRSAPAGSYFAFNHKANSTAYYWFVDDIFVREAYTDADITAFEFTTPNVQTSEAAVIDNETQTISVNVSFSANLSAVVPHITISSGATISPASEIATDYSTLSKVYTVTAEDGATTKDWTINLTRVAANTEALITSFSFDGQKAGTTAVIDNDNFTVNAVAEWNTNLATIAPTIVTSDFATVTPASGVAQDFTTDVVYTVVSEDGLTTNEYTVTIVNDPDACVNPTDLAVSNIAANTATLTWSKIYTETGYNVKVSSTAITDFTATADAYDGEVVAQDDNTLAITGLTANTTYYVYVQSSCGIETWVTATFLTECDAIATLPYTENFESYTNATSPSGTGEFPECWKYNYSGTYSSYTPKVVKSSSYSVNGSKSLLITAGGTYYGANNYVVMPAFDEDLNNLYVTFDARRYSSTGYLAFGYMTDVNNTSTFTLIGTQVSPTTSSAGTAYSYDLSEVTFPEGAKLAFRWNCTSSSYYCAIDNIVVRILSDANDIVEFSVPDLVAPATIDPENHTVTGTISMNADITSQVPTIVVSDYASVTAVNAGTYTAGAAQDFSANVTYTVTSEIGTTQDWVVTLTNATSLSDANDILTFTFDGIVGEAEIDPETHTVNAVAAWNKALNTIAPVATISNLATIDPAANGAIIRDFTEPVSYLVTAENGDEQPWTVTIINDPDACINPTGLTITDITEVSATISWTASYTETSYNVKVSSTPMTDMSATANMYDGIVEATTLALNNLQAMTTFYVYVQSNCANADGWVNAQFTTACSADAVELPFYEDFTNPQCWNIYDANNDDTSWDFESGEAVYYYSTYNDANDWLVSPKLAIVNYAKMSFEYWSSSTFPEKFSVYVITGTSDNYAEATQIVPTTTVNSSTHTTLPEVDLSAYAGNDVYIGIKCESNADEYYLKIDNFSVSVNAPSYTILATAGENGSITPAGAISVTEGGEQAFTITANAGYQIESVIVDANTENEVDVTDQLAEGVYTFTNVTANHTINATFTEEELPPTSFTITATAGENGFITPEGPITVEAGADQDFIIMADDGYEIVSVIVDADTENEIDVTDQLVNGVYTFTNVTANHTINATFAATGSVTYTITATAGENGSITPEGQITVGAGANQEFIIVADENYEITSVLVDGAEAITELVNGVYTFTNVQANHTIEVTFGPEVSINEIGMSSISAYPNPNNGMFNIDFANIEGTATYQLVDVKGSIIDAQEINVMNGETMQFSYTLTPGAYFVRIISSDNVFVEQIIVR